MSWDLDEILDAAGAGDGEPRLVEVGRALEGGRPATCGYFWSSGRVHATVGPGWVRIRRRNGAMGRGDLRLDFQELRALDLVCRDWVRSRDAWAAFYYSSAGYPPSGGACYYQAPGKHGRCETIGSFMLGRRRGGELSGRDEVVPREGPQRPRDAVRAIAEIWRRGEGFGPAEGSLVGLRYRLVRGVFVDVKREEARVWRKGAEVFLEPDEDRFVSALVSVVGRMERP